MTKRELVDNLEGVSDDTEILMTSECWCIGEILKGSDEDGEYVILDTMKAPNLCHNKMCY